MAPRVKRPDVNIVPVVDVNFLMKPYSLMLLMTVTRWQTHSHLLSLHRDHGY